MSMWSLLWAEWTRFMGMWKQQIMISLEFRFLSNTKCPADMTTRGEWFIMFIFCFYLLAFAFVDRMIRCVCVAGRPMRGETRE